MARQYRSTVEAKTLSAGINSSVGSITLNSVTTLPSSYPYTLVIDPDTATEEIITVTASGGGNSLTVTRGQDGTSGQSHDAAAVVKHMITARDLQEPHDHIDNTTTAHGATGAVVGTTNTQTLTNKTLTSPTINNPTISGTITGAVVTSANIVDATITGSDIASGTVTSTNILDGTIVNADINASAAIDWTKLAVSSTVSATELGYVDGVTSAIQTQLDTKAPLASPTFTGTVTLPTGTVTSGMILDGTILDADVNASADIAQSKIAGMGAWTSFTPTLSSGWSNGNGTWDAKYALIGKTMHISARFTLGSSTGKGTTMDVSIPSGFTLKDYTRVGGFAGLARILAYSASVKLSLMYQGSSSTTVEIMDIGTSANYAGSNAITNTLPAAWATGDYIILNFTVEVA